jgi:hypothetical protein
MSSGSGEALVPSTHAFMSLTVVTLTIPIAREPQLL